MTARTSGYSPENRQSHSSECEALRDDRDYAQDYAHATEDDGQRPASGLATVQDSLANPQ